MVMPKKSEEQQKKVGENLDKLLAGELPVKNRKQKPIEKPEQDKEEFENIIDDEKKENIINEIKEQILPKEPFIQEQLLTELSKRTNCKISGLRKQLQKEVRLIQDIIKDKENEEAQKQKEEQKNKRLEEKLKREQEKNEAKEKEKNEKNLERKKREQEKQEKEKEKEKEEEPYKIFTREGQAELFLKKQPISYDEAGLWWKWDLINNAWKQIDEVEILNSIHNVMQIDTINSKARTEVINSLQQFGRRNLPKKPPLSYIQFKDCIIDLETNKRLEPTSEWFLLNPLPYRYGNSPDTPIMDSIIKSWVGEKYVQTMYDILAFTIYRDYFLKRIFTFVGTGNNGKSCWFNLAAKFLGSHNIVSTEADLLTTNRFEVFKLLYKLVAMMSETEDDDIKQSKYLKKLSGNDPIDFEQKYAKKSITEKNYAKIWINTNLCPEVPDSSDGWFDRQIIITFPNTFDGKTDILATIPEKEYENLGNKCIKILQELLKTRTIHCEGTFADRKKNYESHSNPINLFLKEYTEEDANGFIFKWEFTEKLVAWCDKNKFKKPSDTIIGTKMKAIGYNSNKHSSTQCDEQGNKKQYWAWEGLKWK